MAGIALSSAAGRRLAGVSPSALKPPALAASTSAVAQSRMTDGKGSSFSRARYARARSSGVICEASAAILKIAKVQNVLEPDVAILYAIYELGHGLNAIF